ncbi:MAG TPA: PDZ domain-containing protein, partial [Gemmataceae bacterium]|nr:PDZ domain-containing protein [Gemmataceae bacterium]
MLRRACFLAILAIGICAAGVRAQEDLNDVLEKMTKDAAKTAGASVVQIETRGGADMVVAGPKGQVLRKAIGPTTGVVVDPSGYIITSAYNFFNNPPTILVRVAGHAGEPLVATRVATDRSRMLTLIKVDTKGLPMPAYVPKKDIKEGQFAIALGRALDVKMDKSPAVSVGVISALGRIWGKCLQTDAKISPINYGGPIVDIQGRVQGILIPASPKGDDETAGTEWYDSGIGFAIPMEDVLAVLPRLKEGKDLQKGILGVAMQSQDMYSVLPTVGQVAKASPAEKAGLKQGDTIVEVEGKAVVNMAQVLHILGVKYEGDKVSIKYKRGGEVKEIKALELTGKNVVIAHPFLGILPMRDDPKLGVEIRYVFEKSPAEKMGLKEGDRIVKFGTDEKTLQPFTGQKRGKTQFLDWLNTLTPGTDIKLEVKRKGGGKDVVLSTTLTDMPGAVPGVTGNIPDKLPEARSIKKALDALEINNPNVKPAKVFEQNPVKAETGLMQKATADGEAKFWVYVHDDYDPNIAHGIVVWLHPPGKNKEDDAKALRDLWEDYCAENHLILVMPVLDKEDWIPSASDMVVGAVTETMKMYTIDRQRVVAHGMGVGGQMAIYLGFNHRETFRGVCSVGATAQKIKDNVANQRLSFYIAAGALDPIVKSIAESRTRLAERRYPAFYRQMPERGREYLTVKDLQQVLRWIDSLDQL